MNAQKNSIIFFTEIQNGCPQIVRVYVWNISSYCAELSWVSQFYEKVSISSGTAAQVGETIGPFVELESETMNTINFLPELNKYYEI